MVKNTFSTGWKGSVQVRKQRKYSYNAPLHIKQKMVHVHLSSELKKKYEKRRVQVRTGDKVRVVRGQHKKKEGKVERINLKQSRVFITGIEFIKKDGTKVSVALAPSQLVITNIDLSDRKRKQKVEKTVTSSSRSREMKQPGAVKKDIKAQENTK